MLKSITSAEAPSAIGPYSQAVQAGSFIFVSGQLPICPMKGTLVENNIGSQTERCLLNIKAILGTAGLDLKHVVKTTVYLNDMNDFAAMNEVYNRFFTEPYPSRAAFQVARLPKDALVEIEAVGVF